MLASLIRILLQRLELLFDLFFVLLDRSGLGLLIWSLFHETLYFLPLYVVADLLTKFLGNIVSISSIIGAEHRQARLVSRLAHWSWNFIIRK